MPNSHYTLGVFIYMKKLTIILFLIWNTVSFSQEKKLFLKEEIIINPQIKGSLYNPLKTNRKTNLVILIAGSGPTNRDGNQLGSYNNSLKFLAEELSKKDLAVFSYDKRIIADIIAGRKDNKNLVFDDFVNDAKEVISYFINLKKYNKIIIAGHSEGSLIGILVSKKVAVDGLISIAGPGKSIDVIIEEQITKQMPFLKSELHEGFQKLKTGKTFKLESENPTIKQFFKEDGQPYLISWIKYEPEVEIKNLKIPVLIINGTKDIQVSVENANILKKSNPSAKICIIENMNHIFKEIKGEEKENLASYSDPKLPIMNELVACIYKFIKTM